MKEYALLTFLLALEASSISATQEHKWDEKNLGSIADIESFDSHEIDSTSSNTNQSTGNKKSSSVVPAESVAGIANENQRQTWYEWFTNKKASSISPEDSTQRNANKKKKSKKIKSIAVEPVDPNTIVAYELKREAKLPNPSAVKGLSWQTAKVRANILAEQASIDNIRERLKSCMSRCVRNADELFSGRESDLQNICSDNCIRQERAVLSEIKRELEKLVKESEERFRSTY